MRMSIDNFALEVSDQLGMTKKQAKAHVQAIFEVLAENMSEGHEVNIPDFGKFRRKDKKERKARNPKTGEEIMIPAKSVPNFLASKKLRLRCNGELTD